MKKAGHAQLDDRQLMHKFYIRKVTGSYPNFQEFSIYFFCLVTHPYPNFPKLSSADWLVALPSLTFSKEIMKIVHISTPRIGR